MRRALRLARDYGVAVRFCDFGEWSGDRLRAEYDATVPEIRINRRIATSLSMAELTVFVRRAIGHELYHHREHIGEVPRLTTSGEREAAADAFAARLECETPHANASKEAGLRNLPMRSR